MTRDEVIRLAREVIGNVPDNWVYRFDVADLERFAALVAAHEREACAKVCDEEGLVWGQRYAAAIRARGNV